MMITYKDITNVLNAVIPLYVTMFLAYASVKWWKVFSAEQCSGINRFVAIFAVPLLSFEFISRIDPFNLNYLFVAADAVSKIIVLVVVLSWAKFSPKGSLDWSITAFSLTTLPNTLVMGIPLLKSMYGDNQEDLMIQVVVLQSVIWYTLLLFLFELRAARNALMVIKISDQSTSTKAERSSTEDRDHSISVHDMSSEDELVHVIVAAKPPSPPAEPEQLRVLQNSNKVAPESSEKEKREEEYGKELHMFVWRCACCDNPQGLCEHSVQVCSRRDEESGDADKAEECTDQKKEEQLERDTLMYSSMSPEVLRLIMSMVWSKLIRNPNTYASIFGLIWALVSAKWDIKKPVMMENSVTILSNAGLGMAMFSLGLFMALQPRIIACGSRLAAYGMLMKFVAGPAVMAIASLGVGIRGKTLKVSIVQAALPQGIVPFVFAREYNLHSEVLSTGVIFGMIISLPITILYYVLLGL